MIWLVWACHKPMVEPPEVLEPLPIAAHLEAEAEALLWNPDPARGGPALRNSQSPLPPFKGVNRKTATYVGAETCTGCHAAEYEKWSTTAHAQAMEPLNAANRDHDPSCIRCHFTGFQHPGSALKKSMAKVGCESCHGPASDHLKAVSESYGLLPASSAACVACHNYDNSPDFRWDRYWLKIAH